jgi:MutL C terminal dimerisation domain
MLAVLEQSCVQVANKLIITRSGNVLLAIDQHAADERIRLEQLQQQLLKHLHVVRADQPGNSTALAQSAADSDVLASVPVRPPQPAYLSWHQLAILMQHQVRNGTVHPISHWSLNIKRKRRTVHVASQFAAADTATVPAPVLAGDSLDMKCRALFIAGAGAYRSCKASTALCKACHNSLVTQCQLIACQFSWTHWAMDRAWALTCAFPARCRRCCSPLHVAVL